MSPQETFIRISLENQTLSLVEKGQPAATFPISSARKGMGNQTGSNRTPTGRFRVAKKIGDTMPIHTMFRGRVPVGTWDGRETDEDLILSRILWLDGLEESNRNTMDRFIYLHGTNHETRLGTPASQGCIRLANSDMITVFDWAREDTEVEILPATTSQVKLCFLDCDSTLSTIEGIDELARARGPEVLEKVEALTNSAMNGEIPISEVFPRRMGLIRPDRPLCDQVGSRYVETVVKGAAGFIHFIRSHGWTPVILSGGFAPLIAQLAEHLGILDVEAVPLHLDECGKFLDYGRDYPTTRNHGKNEIIREWKAALLPACTIMIGDGISDLETQTDVDHFIGFGGVVKRPQVEQAANYWLDDFENFGALKQIIETPRSA